MDTFFCNITSDVLSYAYQLLFYITLPCEHSSILPVSLGVDAAPSGSVQHREDNKMTGKSCVCIRSFTGLYVNIPGLFVAVNISLTSSPRLTLCVVD